MSFSSLLSQDYFLNRVLPNLKTISQKRRLLLRLKILKQSYNELIDYINTSNIDSPNDLDLFTKELDKIDNLIELVNIELFK